MAHPIRTAVTVAAGALLAVSTAFAGPVDVGHLYELSDFTGMIPYSDARVVADPTRDELFTIYGNEVRIFNTAGMQTYSFAVDASTGQVVDLAVDADGALLLLVYPPAESSGTRSWTILRADYRGRPTGELTVTLPDRLTGFRPTRMVARGNTLWLVDQSGLVAASFAANGAFERSVDLGVVADVEPSERQNVEISGFDVDAAGTLTFAIPVRFRVYVVAPDGSARSFGKVGSSAGNFGLVSGVVNDGKGHIVVADRLRSVVMVFDSDFRFLREFSQIDGRSSLIRPGDMAYSNGKLFVSQLRSRGVAVFAMTSGE